MLEFGHVVLVNSGSGNGCVYTGDEDDTVEEMLDDEEEDLTQLQIDKLRLARISSNSLAPDNDAIDFRDERIAELERDEHADNDSVLTFGSDNECDTSDIEEIDDSGWDEEGYNTSVLYREIKATIERCRDQNIADKSDILLEVANLKIADNASLTTYASCVLLSVFDLIDPTPTESQKPSTAVLKSLSRLLREYNFLLEKYGQGSEKNLIMFIRGLVKACIYEEKPYRALFPFALKALYQLEAISGEAILEWAHMGDSDPELVNLASELIEYLRESDEETESDED